MHQTLDVVLEIFHGYVLNHHHVVAVEEAVGKTSEQLQVVSLVVTHLKSPHHAVDHLGIWTVHTPPQFRSHLPSAHQRQGCHQLVSRHP